nr:CBS domain-containing protein CBSCBSPB5-like isoform X1 [Tanacetum cinerariifolium]
MAAKAMLECGLNSAIVTADNKPRGILTSRDILMRVTAQGLPPDSTLVEKVMTPNPQSATIDTLIVEALRIMNDGKFLHLPVVDRDGDVVAVIDVLQITDAAVALVGSTAGTDTDAASSMMQVLWNFAMGAPPADDDSVNQSGDGYWKSHLSSSWITNTFDFKIQDRKGRMHIFICETHSLTNLITAILQRVDDEIDRNNRPYILYEDEDKDKVILASDSDLAAAVEYARSGGRKE